MIKESVMALIFHKGDPTKVLAVSRKDDPTDFGLPGGKVDPNESFEEALTRELTEETGLDVFNLKPLFTHQNNIYLCVYFLADYEGEIHTEEDGVVRWKSPEELCEGTTFGKFNRAFFEHVGLLDLKGTNGN